MSPLAEFIHACAILVGVFVIVVGIGHSCRSAQGCGVRIEIHSSAGGGGR